MPINEIPPQPEIPRWRKRVSRLNPRSWRSPPGKINLNIWLLTFNDVFNWGVHYVVTILIGLYLSQKLGYPAIEVVGIGAGLAYLTRGLVQIPLGLLGDRLNSLSDEILLLISGNMIMGLGVIAIVVVTEAWQYYLIQIFFGFGMTLNIVDWRKLFAKNLDVGREGLEYAVYDTSMSLAIASLSAIGGVIASLAPVYFDLVILVIGAIILVSNLWVIPLYRQQARARW